MTNEQRAFLSVSCPLCKATRGNWCTLPKGAPYYQRDANGSKSRAFHSMRKKRAFALYQIHATALELERRDNRRIQIHPKVQHATTTLDGCKVISVDFHHKEGS